MRFPSMLLAILFSAGFLQAADSTGTLTISTWPSHADLYVGERPASFVDPAARQTPASIDLLPGMTDVRVTLFREEYKDTTLDIHIKGAHDSYIMLMLQPEADAAVLEAQQKILSHRARNAWGRRLVLGSALPLALSGIFAAMAYHQFNEADDYAERIENSIIRNGDSFDHLVDEQAEHKKSGRNYRTSAITTLCLGTAMLLTGMILSF